MAASCADEVALQYATKAAIASPTTRPFPAAFAAGPNAANTPAPIIDPRPIATASKVPRRRARRVGAFSSEIACMGSADVAVADEGDVGRDKKSSGPSRDLAGRHYDGCQKDGGRADRHVELSRLRVDLHRTHQGDETGVEEKEGEDGTEDVAVGDVGSLLESGR